MKKAPITGPLTFPRPRPVYLTDHERKVLTLFSKGITPKAIGEKFGVSHTTVRAALKRIRQKYRIPKMSGLADLAVKEKLVKRARSK